MGHDKKKSAAPPPGPGPLPYLENLVHPCVRLPTYAPGFVRCVRGCRICPSATPTRSQIDNPVAGAL